MKRLAYLGKSMLSFESQSSSRFTSAAAKVLFSSVFTLLLNISTGVLVARFLGPDGRGEQAAMIMWPQFLAYILTFGIPSSLVYYLKTHKERSESYFSAAVLLSVVLGMAAAIGGWFLVPYWLREYSSTVVLFSQISLLLCPPFMMAVFLNSVLQAYDQFKLLNLAKVFGPTVTLILIVLFAGTGTMTPTITAIAYLIGGLPITICLFIVLARRLRFRFRVVGTRYKELFRYGIKAYGIDLLGTISMQIDQLLVVALLKPAEMGLYVIALSLSKMLRVFQTSIVTVLFPKAAGNDESRVMSMTMMSFRIGTFITASASVLAFLMAPFALRILYGNEFMPALIPFQILLIREVVSSGTGIVLQFFMATGRPGFVSTLQGVGITLNVPLMLLLLPSFGLVGVASALLVTSLIRLVVIGIYMQIQYTYPMRWVITRQELLHVFQEVRTLLGRMTRRARSM
jgi:O-antigen/teichoic acid export membrane protein